MEEYRMTTTAREPEKLRSSKIRVEYNQKLKDFCKKVNVQFAAGLQYLNFYHTDYTFQLRLQTEIRDYIIAHQDEITIKGKSRLELDNTSSYPSLFAIYLCIIADLNTCNTCNDARQQIDFFLCKPVTDWVGDPRCVCSKPCNFRNLLRVQNLKTNLVCIIGSSCIYKYELIDPTVQKKALKENRRFEALEKRRNEDNEARAINHRNGVLMRTMFNALKKKCRDCEEPIRHLPWGPYCCKKPGCDCQLVKKHYCMCCGVKKYSKNAKRRSL